MRAISEKKEKREKFSLLRKKKTWKERRCEELQREEREGKLSMHEETEKEVSCYREALILYRRGAGKVISMDFVKQEPLRWEGLLEAGCSPDGGSAVGEFMKAHPRRY